MRQVEVQAPNLPAALATGQADAASLIHSQAWRAMQSGDFVNICETGQILNEYYGPLVSAINVSYPERLAARPEAISLTTGDIVMPALITGVDFLGSVIRITALAGGESLAFDTFNSPNSAPPHIGAEVDLRINAEDLLVLAD